MSRPAPDGRLRVEMILPTLARAGMEVVTCDLVEGLATRGHHVGVTCLEAGGPLESRLEASRIRATVVRTPGVLSNFRASALTQHLRTVRPHVVHAHNGVWLKALVAARHAGIARTVLTVHGFQARCGPVERVLIRAAAQRAQRTVVVAHAVGARMVREMGARRERLVTIPNGIDCGRFRPGPDGELRRSLGVEEGALLVGTVARLEPVKNQALLIEAIALSRETVPMHVVLVGDGPCRGALAARASECGVEKRVHFLGTLEDPAAFYRSLDAFALTSLTEGTSLSLLEAMASGLACVATDVGGNAETLGDTGLLVPSGDARRLADALADLHRSSADRARLGTAARRRAEASFSRTAMIDAYELLYRSLDGADA